MAHLYWRLHARSNNGSSGCGFSELGLHTTVGGSQAAMGGTASGTNVNASYPASNLFDGNINTYSIATGNGSIEVWWQYLFPSAVNIVEYSLTARNDTFTTDSPRIWSLDYSDDGANWTAADSVYSQTGWTQAQVRTFLVGSNTNAPSSNGHKSAAFNSSPIWTPPAFAGGHRLTVAAPTSARSVSGNVQVAGVATAGLLVRAYAKATGELIGSATTDGSGNYSINCGSNWADVEVIAFDPTTYQALIYDQVVPG
ncbi:discoidin domain-containing protein [Burkholderia anthina]|uniref:discoidin domain-containing protein n=1 Tax=Burkholderia anthina TaxID=179879 RepID=UPI0037C18113